MIIIDDFSDSMYIVFQSFGNLVCRKDILVNSRLKEFAFIKMQEQIR